MSIDAGSIVIVNFPGAKGIKRRPAIVISTNIYHTTRPDVICSVITSQTASATAPSDYILQDWSTAGLNKESAFRAFIVTLPAQNILSIVGKVSNRDWKEIQKRLLLAVSIK